MSDLIEAYATACKNMTPKEERDRKFNEIEEAFIAMKKKVEAKLVEAAKPKTCGTCRFWSFTSSGEGPQCWGKCTQVKLIKENSVNL